MQELSGKRIIGDEGHGLGTSDTLGTWEDVPGAVSMPHHGEIAGSANTGVRAGAVTDVPGRPTPELRGR